MAWFKLNDRFHSEPKVVAAGNAAIGLYCRLGTYCADMLTDGFIPEAIARSMGTNRELKALTVCPIPDTRELLTVVPGGYLMRDYLEYNPSREQVLADRAKAKERMDRLRGKPDGSADVRANKRANNKANNARSSSTPIPTPLPDSWVSSERVPTSLPTAGEGGDNSDRLAQIAKAYGQHAAVKAQASSENYWRKAAERVLADPRLAELAARYPTAPVSAIAAALHNEPNSLRYFESAEESTDAQVTDIATRRSVS